MPAAQFVHFGSAWVKRVSVSRLMTAGGVQVVSFDAR